MNPLVCVLGLGDKSPTEVIKNIVKSPDGANNPEMLTFNIGELPAYVCDMKTKYYETQISLIPFTDDVDSIPSEVLNATEALIVYFDAKDKAFLQVIPKLNKIVEDNHIELGLLLTDNLYDEAAMGLSFKDVKSKCTNTFDLIELCGENDDDDDNDGEDVLEASGNNAHSYKEVHQALNNNIWSNIEIGNSAGGSGLLNQLGSVDDSPTVEDQLEAFDALLSNIQNFKRITANMNRDQVLDEAEKIAQLFENMLNED